jgi:hypothetical protein
MKLFYFVMLSSRDAKLSSWVATELPLVVAAVELSLLVAVVELTLVVVVVELSVVVVAAELSLVVVVAEVTAVVVAATQVVAVMVATTQVATMVVVATEVAAVVVTSLNWKIQSLPRQTQCPSCAIGRDNQRFFQVSIHHSLQGTPACFHGGQDLPCPQVI